MTALLMLVAAAITLALETARHGFDLLLSVGAGTGLLYLLRWFWWRINAWSEIAAMVSSFLIAAAFFLANKLGADIPTHLSLVATVVTTTAVWLAVTWLTPPTERATLARFYQLVRPGGPGWAPFRQGVVQAPGDGRVPLALVCWVAGCLFVYAALFGTGSFLYGRVALDTTWLRKTGGITPHTISMKAAEADLDFTIDIPKDPKKVSFMATKTRALSLRMHEEASLCQEPQGPGHERRARGGGGGTEGRKG